MTKNGIKCWVLQDKSSSLCKARVFWSRREATRNMFAEAKVVER